VGRLDRDFDRLGKLDVARTFLDWCEGNAERLPSPYGIGTAARCRGLLPAQGDLDSGFAAYERALAALEGFDFPLALGRVLLDLGSAHRQAKQKRAAREARALGARPWAEQARTELRRISGRRPGDETLTETEERVARLAAQGHPNKEIASALFISVHTVESHLTSAYRKLEVRSRGGLAPKLTPAREDSRD
jgi:DNA-binding CsgD family transcriptional regulator